MSRRAIRFTQNLALSAVTILAGLVLLEVAFRMVVPVDAGSSFMYRRPHPTRGWSLEEDVEYTNVIREPPVSIHKHSVRHSSWGFRDVEHSKAKEPDVLRILVLGDSFMEGYSVPGQDLFARQLEEALRRASRSVEVVNLGVGGYGTLQEYLLWSEVGRRLDADVVLLAMYLDNDLRDNDRILDAFIDGGRSETRPYLLPGVAWRVTKPDYDDALGRYRLAKTRREEGWRGLLHRSSLATKAMSVLEGLSAGHGPDPATRTSSEAADLDEVSARFGLHFCSTSRHYARAWRTTRRVLARLRSEVEASGATFHVFHVPARHEVEAKEIEAVESRGLPGQLCLQEAVARDRLREMCDGLQIEFVDLLDAFRDRSAAGQQLYWQADRHWNSRGHRAAARVVAAALERSLGDRRWD